MFVLCLSHARYFCCRNFCCSGVVLQGAKFFTIFLHGVLLKLAGVSPFAVILFGQFVPSSLSEGYYLLIMLFFSKSKKYIFSYPFPCEGERTTDKHRYFFIAELDNKSQEYFMRKNRSLKFPSVPGGLCGFYKYFISLCCFRCLALKRQGRTQISVRGSH